MKQIQPNAIIKREEKGFIDGKEREGKSMREGIGKRREKRKEKRKVEYK